MQKKVNKNDNKTDDEKRLDKVQLNWFPGHMTKACRMMRENLDLIDIVIELVDARLPLSSRNPDIDDMVKDKPRILVLNKSDISDGSCNKEWESYFANKGITVLSVSSVSGKSLNFIFDKCKIVLKDKIQRQKERGLVNRPIKIMICGIPNVGKSSFINKLSGRKSTITGDRPGVTKGKQWIRLKNGFELLDTPGVLWPKFEDMTVGEKLAYTGAIKDQILDVEFLACKLLLYFKENYPESLKERYKMENFDDMDGYELLKYLGKRRGFVMSGGEIDTLRAANVFFDEFRGAKLGKISLERPSDFQIN